MMKITCLLLFVPPSSDKLEAAVRVAPLVSSADTAFAIAASYLSPSMPLAGDPQTFPSAFSLTVSIRGCTR